MLAAPSPTSPLSSPSDGADGEPSSADRSSPASRCPGFIEPAVARKQAGKPGEIAARHAATFERIGVVGIDPPSSRQGSDILAAGDHLHQGLGRCATKVVEELAGDLPAVDVAMPMRPEQPVSTVRSCASASGAGRRGGRSARGRDGRPAAPPSRSSGSGPPAAASRSPGRCT
jgi:hypothetical protein